MINKKLQSIEIIDKMSREQVRDYWYELKQTRYDGYYFRELYDKIIRLNPNLILPKEEEIKRIEKDALSIAFWEENWEITNERRVKNGGVDYSILKCNPAGKNSISSNKQKYYQQKVV